MRKSIIFAVAAVLVGAAAVPASAQTRGVEHGRRYDRLVIRNVTIIDGQGSPPRGPMDVVVENKVIVSERGAARADAYAQEAHVLDGTGMYLLPGLINAHVHLQDEAQGIAQPFEYSYRLWLGCGITTVRDVGSDVAKTFLERQKSAAGTIVAPRLVIYVPVSSRTPEEARLDVREVKKQGGDGVKIFGLDRDIMKAVVEEAHKLGLRVSHHSAVEKSDAWDDAAFGVTSIEHWYGIPNAAVAGLPNVPLTRKFSNESDQFRLWGEASPDKLGRVFEALITKHVAWVPTFVIFETNRDLLRAQNQPWFKDYLHPALAAFFDPNPANQAYYPLGWSTTEEIFWKEHFRIWMKAVRDFADKGGVVGAGEDAGFIYEIYGFGLIRELELLQEAGFRPLDVVQAATGNNARILGMEDRLGRIRPGYLADLILLDENPLANLKFLYPTGVLDWKGGKPIVRGGVKFTIKDGIVYNAGTLLADVRAIVAKARAGAK